jgi:hypothetical protein
MNIKLIDVDSKIPNLALMQLAAYHRANGDTVGFDVSNPDKVYISCIFKKNAEAARGISTYFPDADVVMGGTGINLKTTIPEDAQKAYPDYNLYPNMNYSLGFTTRGCIRKCGFCVVPEKEGMIHRWQHIKEFYNPKFKDVALLDNNITACKDWFFENTDFILEKGLKLKLICGMDIRLITEEIAQRLKLIKWISGNFSFAFDNPQDEKKVLKGIEILQQAGINLRNVSFFVLTGYNTSFSEDIYRCNVLREHGTNAFVMQYLPNANTRKLARWANRRWIYWKIPFEEYWENGI